MNVDWFTVIAQALNFVILVWILKRFLYGPIVRTIQARDKKVAADLEDARTTKAEAERERAEFEEKNLQFEKDRDSMKEQASSEAAAEKKRILLAARAAADATKIKRDHAMREEALSLTTALAQRAQREVFDIARKTLLDLAAASLEERASEVFVERLRSADKESLAEFAHAVKSDEEPLIVQSAFDLPKSARRKIEEAIHDTFSKATPVEFNVAPRLVSGIELTKGGLKLGWSIDEYLRSMEAMMDDFLSSVPESTTAVQAPVESAAEPHAS